MADNDVSVKYREADSSGVYYPKKNEILNIIKNHPETVLVDQKDRYYGVMPPSVLTDQTKRDPTFSELDTFAWVYIGDLTRGKRDPETYHFDNVKEFPDVDEVIKLSTLVQKNNFIGSAVVLRYIEQIRQFGKSGSLVFRQLKD